MNDPMLDKLLSAKKYRDVCPDTIRRIWDECRVKYKKPKDAEKAARESLHGITGAFLTSEEARRCADAMEAWANSRADADLAGMLDRHASTRERLPLARMDATYERIFSVTGRPGSVLDLACGINPLYLGARGIPTLGVDISGQSVGIINAFGSSCGAPVRAVCADLLCEDAIPREHFHVALLFKILPLLERQRNGAATDVLAAIDADFLVISFPTRTLGGRNVGMEDHYSKWMESHLPDNCAVAARLTEENELFYILEASRA